MSSLPRATLVFCLALPRLLAAPSAIAQAAPTGAPPADEAALVAAPKNPAAAAPAGAAASDVMHASVSAGGQLASGNSNLYAATATGKFDIRRGSDVFAAGLIGNYSYSEIATTPSPGTPPTSSWKKSTENVQGKVRYERFLTNNASLYAQVTGTHDAFQAIAFRLNLDPGFKYLLVKNPSTTFWGEVGYDFQYDDHFVDSNDIEQAGAGGPELDANGYSYLISSNDTIESSRLFLGFNQAFNKDVNLNAGLEYLQGFGGSGSNPPGIPAGYMTCATMPASMATNCVDPVSTSLGASRINLDALFAANVGGGFSFGVGYSLKYNSDPLPGKKDIDQAATFNIIYALTSPPPKPPAPPLCAPPAPPPPPPEGLPVPTPTPTPAPTPAPAPVPPLTSEASSSPPRAQTAFDESVLRVTQSSRVN
jgi:putative salt-induced outer membrane protein YdiY